MRKLFTLFLAAAAIQIDAQHKCALMKSGQAEKMQVVTGLTARHAKAAAQQTNEHGYDMKFVHLDLDVEATTKYISGNARMLSQVAVAALDTFAVILHEDLTVDSVKINGVKLPFIRQDSLLFVKLPAPLAKNAAMWSHIWYKGTPPSGGSALGDGFSNATDFNYGEDVTWSLSESFVAYHWWPCKQVLTDKIDSSWVFVTTDTANKAASNGVLENVVPLGAKHRFEWKSRAPIAYYLISVAVAQYESYDIYAKPQYLNDSILVQNFIYKSAYSTNFWKNMEKPQINKVPQLIELYSGLFGMYPFHDEKYGQAMAAVGGGMEHQTMSTMGTMMYFWLNAHELAHQWWGDNVTCKSWGDIFINEGFASYAEHLAHEYLQPQTFESHLGDAHTNVMKFPGGSIHFTDTMNTPRIFSSRLTYDKGGAILHTLRFVTHDDSLWFGALRGFQQTFKGKTASAKDFINFYHSFTGIDPTQFFQQWYYGEGYPTFDARWNFGGGKFYLRVSQTTSMPSATPLFVTPIEYRIFRTGMPDTIVRVVHDEAVENYTFALNGSVNTVHVDPANWIINAHLAAKRDISLGIDETVTASDFRVWPNPTDGAFHVEVPVGTEGTLTVHDVSGRELRRELVSGTSRLDLSVYEDGMYFVTFSDGPGLKTTRLIKTK